MRSPLLPAALLPLALLAACGADDGGATASPIEVEGAWARSTADGQEAGAAYMRLTSDADDAVVSAAVAAAVADVVELHETGPATPGEDAGMDVDGMGEEAHGGGDMGAMTMREVDAIELPAGEEVVLEPGGLHVMLLDLTGPLEPGATFTVTLTTASGAEVPVEVEVADQPPS